MLRKVLMFGLGTLGLAGVAGPAISGGPAGAGVAFERLEILTGSAAQQTVLTGSLLGGPAADLAVLHVDENHDPQLRIVSLRDGAWQTELEAELRSGVRFVDVAGIAGQDRLVTYERACRGSYAACTGRLSWFDPASATERPLVSVPSDFDPDAGGRILHVDVSRDLTGDGRDDLVLPDVDGFWVFVQTSAGRFADPVKIGPPIGAGATYEIDGYRHDPWRNARVHELDYNRDGRRDLAFWNGDRFEVHLQDERGLFPEATETFTTEVAFDSDDLDTLAAPNGVRRRRKDHQPAGEITGRVLHSLNDINGDGVADLSVFSLEGGSLWRMRSTYEVHFGSPAGESATRFAPEVGAAVRSDGIPFAVEQHDFDRDGRVDMLFTTINPGVFKAIGMLASALFRQTVSPDLELYRMEDGAYSAKPTVTRKSYTDVAGGSGERTGWGSVLVGDVNGDGHSDLLIGRGKDGLRIFPGVPGPALFARRPVKVAVAMPDEEYTWLVDIDKDGKQDVLMHHPSTTEPHRVTLLLAR